MNSRIASCGLSVVDVHAAGNVVPALNVPAPACQSLKVTRPHWLAEVAPMGVLKVK